MSLADTFAYLQELPPERRQPYLEAALQEEHVGVQCAALHWLLQPGAHRRPDLVVDHFAAFGPAHESVLAPHRDELLALARAKIVGGRDIRRLGAFKLVAALGDLGSADLLVIGITDPNAMIAELAFAGLVDRLRIYAQARREAIAKATAVAPATRTTAQEAAWQAFGIALRQCPDERAGAMSEVLFEFGTLAMSQFRGVLQTRPNALLCRIFVQMLGTGPAATAPPRRGSSCSWGWTATPTWLASANNCCETAAIPSSAARSLARSPRCGTNVPRRRSAIRARCRGGARCNTPPSTSTPTPLAG